MSWPKKYLEIAGVGKTNPAFAALRPLQIVILAYSGYADVFRITLGQLQGFATKETPLEVFVLADRRDFVELALSELDHNNSMNVRQVVEYSEEQPFWKKLVALEQAPLDKYFVAIQEDFVLFEQPDWKTLVDVVEAFKKTRYSFLRLVPSGHQHPKPREFSLANTKLVEVDRRSAYHHSWQATLWKRSSFFLLNRLAKPRSIRDENKSRYRKALRLLRIKGLASQSALFPYVQTAVRSGLWDYGAKFGGEYLPTILRQYGVDPELRGIRGRS